MGTIVNYDDNELLVANAPFAGSAHSGTLPSKEYAKDYFVAREEIANYYAAQGFSLVFAYLENLKSYNLESVVDVDPWAAVDSGGLNGINPDEPAGLTIDSDIVVDVPSFTETGPDMPDVDITIEPAPAYNVVDPGFNIPSVPNVEFPHFTTSAPGITDPVIPTSPSFDLPPVPSLSGISIPSIPEYNLPAFDAETPAMDITPPEPMFVWNEAEYNSELKLQLEQKLLEQIISGGTGLDEETEQAIYDRATARQETENNQMYDEALNFFSSRGWRLPPGALSGRLLDVSYKITQTRTDLNNDILVQQSKLAQENTQFIIDRAIQNEKNMMDYINQYQQRSFDAAKFVVEGALIIYQAKVEAYKAQLEVYKTKAVVYETRIRAEIAKAELYKAQIEGIKVSVDAQRLMIEAYKAQVESIGAYIEIYKAEMQGAQIEADINRIRIAAFGELVKAYEAQVGAVTARYNAYQAQIAGEEAKARMYAAQVDGYKSRVEAYKAKAEVEIAEVQAQAELNKGRVESFKAKIEEFRARVTAAVEQAKAEVEVERLSVAVYEAEVSKYSEELKALVQLYMGKVEEAKAAKDAQIRKSDVLSKESVAKWNMIQSSNEAAAKVASQLFAAAISAVSASAAVGFQASERKGISASANSSVSYSLSKSDSTSHTYFKDETG